MKPDAFATDHPYENSDPASALKDIASMGAMQSFEFKGVALNDGWNQFDVSFQYGRMQFRFAPLASGGKLAGFEYRVLP